MVKEKKTGKMFAMKCVKKKQKRDLNLENEITVLRRFEFFFCFDGHVSVRGAVKSALFLQNQARERCGDGGVLRESDPLLSDHAAVSVSSSSSHSNIIQGIKIKPQFLVSVFLAASSLTVSWTEACTLRRTPAV